MNCPICEKGTAELKIEKKKRILRKEEYELFEYFYKCSSCKEEFTTTDIDTINTNQVYNQYREKYSIPSPKQLTFLREHYNLSAVKMSELLGFGTNQYRLYENGELPIGGNATVLSFLLKPSSFKEILISNKTLLSEKKFEEVIQKVESKINSTAANRIEHLLFSEDQIPNRLTGFSVPDFKKFANMVLYFIGNAPFKVRLNKLLFYADFSNYKYSGFSISGCKYAAIDMGSVPDQFSLIFGLLESKEYVTTELVEVKDKEHEKFVPLKKFNKDLFDNIEISSLKKVLEEFKYYSTQHLMDISHQEPAWINNIKNKNLIDYSLYAPQLKAL